eukprot:Seg2718.2 transcript_id=Seg2718.2/GoldUCD/mRNA.D3Y31 product="BTB/POZ domain-containing protein KCTD8" protein_id=Seg2718.2/GoldUCD/D3Y31
MPLLKVPKTELICKNENPKSFEIITLNVGGMVYETLKGPLMSTDSLLKAMVYHTDDCRGNTHAFYWYNNLTTNVYFIDRDGTQFRHILNYLRNVADAQRPNWPTSWPPKKARQVWRPIPYKINEEDKSQLVEEAKFYNLMGLVEFLEDNKANWARF